MPLLAGGGCLDFKDALKSFLGGVSGLNLAATGGGADLEGVRVEMEPFLSSDALGLEADSCEMLSARLLETAPATNPAGSPLILIGFVVPPGGGDLIRPPMLTSCLLGPEGLRPRSTLPFCFALAISDIHAGCEGGGTAFGFGESGLFSALSSQLDFVGLHLLGSAVFVGLVGGDASERVATSGEISGVTLRLCGVLLREAGRAGLTNTS